jgi:NADH:ubiquinone reductase (H+-translocating)
MSRSTTRLRVVIIGSGFGGLFAAKALKQASVDVTLVSRTTHHLFQPLLYQVATGILSEGEIAPATREVLRRQRNVRVLLGDVTRIDLATRTVTSDLFGRTTLTRYDRLVVAAGATQDYFGNDRFAEHAPGMKTIEDALELRACIFGAFELAEAATDPDETDRLLTFVVIGAGPTGVEMAGQISELARRTLPGNYRSIDPRAARIILLDAMPTVLASFGNRLSRKTARHLRKIGVELQLGARVVGMDATGLEVADSEGRRRISSLCKIWAAGVTASPLGAQLAEQSGAELDRAGRIKAQADLTLPGHPEVFVIGDMIGFPGLPGLAQVAIQSGRYAADQIARSATGEPSGGPFRYRDKGNMATVSRSYAVASIGPLRMAGFPAWLLWLAVHLIYLVGFKNRFTTLFDWAVAFIGRGRSERTLITQQVLSRNAIPRQATASESPTPTWQQIRITPR